MKGRITVQLKAGVLDVEGTAIARALTSLGFDAPQVRVGRVFEVELGDAAAGDPGRARAILDEMARKLLANPVMERFEVEVVDTAAGAP
jgi:phosphoribosylformylglycinamidine synthase PurS subunit